MTSSEMMREDQQVVRFVRRNTYILLTKFEVRTVSYGPSFFPFDLWPKREARKP